MTFYLFIFLILFAVGLVFLTFSADLLVRGASKLAEVLGVSPFVIGATIVAYGTSMPEFMVSSIASINEAGPIALGNVVGSNLFNTGLILGMAALVFPLTIDKPLMSKLKRIELPFIIILTGAAFVVSFAGQVTRPEGIALLAIFSAYIILTLRKEWADRKERQLHEEAEKEPVKKRALAVYGLATLMGLAGLLISARLMVDSAVVIAELLGVSERIIGLTIVALGTSLPEMAAAVAAALKKESKLVLGNLIGSNLFNLGLILGTAAALRPIPVQPEGHFLDFGFLMVNALLITLFVVTKRGISRWEGAVLVSYYVAFAVMLAIL